MPNLKNIISNNLQLAIFFVFCLSFSISAQCLSGECVNGEGAYKYPSGAVYEGKFVNDKKEGKGIYKFTTGEIYEGTFVNDKMDGQGIFIGKSGSKYVGAFKNGKKEGFGKQIYSNGNVYEGDFVNDIKSGKGTYTFKNGNVYIGEFKLDERNGFGTFYNKQQNTSKYGFWQDDKMTTQYDAPPEVKKRSVNESDDEAFSRLFDECDKGDSKSAIIELTALIERLPQSSTAYSVRGFCNANKQGLNNALADAEKALSITPNNVLALTVRGYYKSTQKDFDGGIKDFDRALILDPNNKLASSMLAQTYNLHPNPLSIPAVVEKLTRYKKEAEQSNQNYETYLKLDDFFSSIKQYSLRSSYFESLTNSDEKNVCANYFAGKVYNYNEKKQYLDKAIYNFNGVNGARCSAEAAFWVGRYYNEPSTKGVLDTKEALKYFNLAYQRDPSIPNLAQSRADLMKLYPDTDSSSNTEIVRKTERRAEINRRHLQNIKDLESRSAQYNKYNEERNKTLDTTPARRAQLLELMKKEMSGIIEFSNKAFSELGSELTQEQKNFYLNRIQTAKARLTAISQ